MRSINLFLIDDDATYVFLTKKTIKLTNYNAAIKEFCDGKEAIDYLQSIMSERELWPDIIFLDLSMPVMDGWEFLEEYALIVSAFDKRIPLYIVSSSISPYDIDRAKNIPIISDFIIKPLLKEKLIELLNDIETQ
ncbi:MAG: response regulator [Bacteroidia bacterium]|nr:response regulator [Bacteroidia bacterium]